MHYIKPRASLSDVLRNKLSGKATFEKFSILKRIMELRKWHARRLHPRIKNFCNALTAAATMPTFYYNFIDIRPMQILVCRKSRDGLFFELLKTSDQCVFFTVLAFPHRDRIAPIAVAGNVPIRR